MRLGPFGRSQQTGFLAVPEAVNDGPLRLPPLLPQLRQPTGLFQFRARARYRVTSSIDPGVVMITANHPFVRISGTWDTCNYVIERLAVPAELQMQVRLGRTRPHVISERQIAAPGFRNDITAQVL